jgi:CRISPR-associated protein Cmr1
MNIKNISNSLDIFSVYNYRVEAITPIKMYGNIIDGNKMLELRSSSIKGIIRWWYRFFKSSFLEIDKLKEKENLIFGSTKNSSCFYISITNISQENKQDAYPHMNDQNLKDKKLAKKTAFYPPFSFDIKLKFLPNSFIDEYIKEIENSLMLLSLFGGIGSRIRRGFGSIQFDNFTEKFFNNQSDLNKIACNIKKELENLKGGKINNDFMNISNTKIYLVENKNDSWSDWETTMNKLRDNLYRKLKQELNRKLKQELDLNKKNIYKQKDKKYRNFPLFIQIKKTANNKYNNKYFGVILIWEDMCNKINSNFSKNLENILKYNFNYTKL